ncbi:NAD(P)H-binding protein [Tenacibaculum maritimum]|uniref:Nucleoside-diphosphate-sugar epimerase n=1 Tax=Tenacibaculum maritimum NCIMB 2154 TaxID=1349785 RepID=A0A2H1E975_9FLAO|nr:NAD(P)H-binding protein [Tenacibaculum maritimum]SFZ82255.1 Nucleoside-diphosphate-sugar epimerase [Tenacibaculum maritimum NCIMB 2154]
MKKTAIILGATGLTGSFLLNNLLVDERYDTIKLFSRRSIGRKHPKIKEYIIDVLNLQESKKDFIGDEVFCCIGTTAKKTKRKSIYRKIDIGIPAAAAKLARENKINTFIVISAMGANEKSKFFYNRVKGEMEKIILEEGIKYTYILRPSLIIGKRKENRFGEDLGNLFAKVLNPFLLGSLKNYRAISAKTIAKAMQVLAESKPKEIKILLSSEIYTITTY